MHYLLLNKMTENTPFFISQHQKQGLYKYLMNYQCIVDYKRDYHN